MIFPEDGRGKWILIILFLVFAAPIVTSWWMYNYTDFGRDGGAYSHGELVRPPRQLPDLGLFVQSGGPDGSKLHGKWSLIYFHSGECLERCRRKLYTLRQLWLAMGDESHRVQRIMALTGVPGSLPGAGYPGQLFLPLGEQKHADFIRAFREVINESPLNSDQLFLVDPLGNLMMRYTPDTEPTGIIKDLNRVLRYSRIG